MSSRLTRPGAMGSRLMESGSKRLARIGTGLALGAWGLALGWSADARAQISNKGVLDEALTHFRTAAEGWESAALSAATRLFWALATISLVWTLGQLALKRAELGEVFSELVRYLLFTGFWAWMLQHGPEHSRLIMDSMQQLGGLATEQSLLTPSRLMDIGFHVLDRVLAQSSLLDPVKSSLSTVLALVVVAALSLVAVNMLVLLVSAWFVAYGGLIVLGFGGCRWTSDMATNYYRMMLSLGLQALAMALLVGAGQTFLLGYTEALGTTDVGIHEQAVLLVIALMLLTLVNRVPPLLGSLANGSSPQYAMGSGAGAAAAFAAGTTAYAAGKAAASSLKPIARAAAAGTGAAALATGGSLMDAFRGAGAPGAGGHGGHAGGDGDAAGAGLGARGAAAGLHASASANGSVFPLPQVDPDPTPPQPSMVGQGPGERSAPSTPAVRPGESGSAGDVGTTAAPQEGSPQTRDEGMQTTGDDPTRTHAPGPQAQARLEAEYASGLSGRAPERETSGPLEGQQPAVAAWPGTKTHASSGPTSERTSTAPGHQAAGAHGGGAGAIASAVGGSLGGSLGGSQGGSQGGASRAPAPTGALAARVDGQAAQLDGRAAAQVGALAAASDPLLAGQSPAGPAGSGGDPTAAIAQAAARGALGLGGAPAETHARPAAPVTGPERRLPSPELPQRVAQSPAVEAAMAQAAQPGPDLVHVEARVAPSEEPGT